MRSTSFATVLILAAGLTPSSHAQGLAPISRTDTRVERSDTQDSSPRGALTGAVTMREEFENHTPGVMGTGGVAAPPTAFSGPHGFQWGANTLRGQNPAGYSTLVDLSRAPIAGNATKAIQLRTVQAQQPGLFLLGATVQWATPVGRSPDQPARASADLYISTLAEHYSFETADVQIGRVTSRAVWGGTCVEGDCADSIPPGAILSIYILGFDSAFFPAQYCFTSGAPDPGCTPPPGVNAGDPVTPPVGQWFSLAVEFTSDLRAAHFIDLHDGHGETIIFKGFDHSLHAEFNRVGWNTAFESQDAFMLIDNLEVSGVVAYSPCLGDTNADGVINFADLNAVLADFGMVSADPLLPGDINADGVVNFTDLNAVLAAFGTSCQ